MLWERILQGPIPIMGGTVRAVYDLLMRDKDFNLTLVSGNPESVQSPLEYLALVSLWFMGGNDSRCHCEHVGDTRAVRKVMLGLKPDPIWSDRRQTLLSAIGKAEEIFLPRPYLLGGLGIIKSQSNNDDPIVVCWHRPNFSESLAIALFAYYPTDSLKEPGK